MGVFGDLALDKLKRATRPHPSIFPPHVATTVHQYGRKICAKCREYEVCFLKYQKQMFDGGDLVKRQCEKSFPPTRPRTGEESVVPNETLPCFVDSSAFAKRWVLAALSAVFDSSEKTWTTCEWSHDTRPGVGISSNRDFVEVPLEITDSSSWRTVSQGNWHLDEHITLLETLALLRCVKAPISEDASMSTLVICLSDNSGCVLAADRSRA